MLFALLRKASSYAALALALTVPALAQTRTALGTAGVGNGTTATLTSVSASTGDTIVVVMGGNSFLGFSCGCSITWNGHVGNTADATSTTVSGNSFVVAILYYYVTSGGTGNLDIQFAGGSNVYFTASKVSALTSTPFDKSAKNTGNSVNASSGSTTTLSQATEFVFGGVSGDTNDPSGTWLNSFSDGQSQDCGSLSGCTLNGSVTEGYISVSSTSGVTAAKTLTTSQHWAAVVATFKVGSTGPSVTPGRTFWIK